MQKTLFAATFAALLGMGGAATAADVYSSGSMKDAPVYLTPPSWAGFYIGVNGGYAWANKDFLDGQAFCCELGYDEQANKLAPAGGFGGGQIGYRIQKDRLVFGVEFDIQGSAIQDSASVSLLQQAAAVSAKSELDWFGTLRGTLGYSLTDNFLVYATGGFAFGGVKDSLSGVDGNGATFASTKDETRTGSVLGGGFEYKISPSISIKTEYQHIDLGKSTLTGDASSRSEYYGYCDVAGFGKFEHVYDTVRVGLNWHLGGQAYEPLK
jgi:outer membrane immunogenic protein